jgi:hypothetical protein
MYHLREWVYNMGGSRAKKIRLYKVRCCWCVYTYICFYTYMKLKNCLYDTQPLFFPASYHSHMWYMYVRMCVESRMEQNVKKYVYMYVSLLRAENAHLPHNAHFIFINISAHFSSSELSTVTVRLLMPFLSHSLSIVLVRPKLIFMASRAH